MADFPSTYTGTPPAGLPYAPDRDVRLAPGVLCLFDCLHSSDPLPAGTPTTGTKIPNIAEDYLIALLGSGARGDYDGTFGLGTGNTSGSTKIERTTKGDIHVLMSQASQTGNAQGAYVDLPSGIKTYLAANPNHHYFVAQAINITRIATGGTGAIVDRPPSSMLYTSGQSAPNAQLYGITPNGIYGDTAHTDISPSLNATGRRFVALDTNSWFGTDPGTITGYPVAWGQTLGSWQSSTYNNRSLSYVLESWLIEDLTVSGRTWAFVDALNKAFYDADGAVGGRRYGDTVITAPAGFP